MIVRRGKAVWVWLFSVAFTLCQPSSVFALDRGTNALDNEKLAIKGGYRIVTTSELQGWLDRIDPRWLSERESILVVDTMPDDSYKKKHIPYADQFEFPNEEIDHLDDKTRAEFAKVLGPDKHRKLVFYCDNTKCVRSHNGAMCAVKLGYTIVYRYPAGIKGWLEAGNPTATAK